MDARAERALKFLAGGLAPSQVASVLGCSPARISQLLAEPEFKARLAEAQGEPAGVAEEDEILNNKYLATEHAILDQMRSQIPYAELRDCTNALRVVGERAERRAARKLQEQALRQFESSGLVTVSLTLPVHCLPKPVYNEQQEIVAIGEQAMAPLSSDAVRTLFATRKLTHIEDQKTLNAEDF